MRPNKSYIDQMHLLHGPNDQPISVMVDVEYQSISHGFHISDRSRQFGIVSPSRVLCDPIPSLETVARIRVVFPERTEGGLSGNPQLPFILRQAGWPVREIWESAPTQVISLASQSIHKMSPPPNAAGIKFANLIRDIVEAGSVCPHGESTLSPIRCIRRPNRKPCKGRIRITPKLDAVVWQCSECESCGEISGWRETGGDFSQFIPGEGNSRLLLGLSEDEYRMLRDAVADSCEEAAAVAGAIWADNEVVISGSPETFESIANTVFDEALVATSMKTHKLLHALSKKIRLWLASS